MVKVTVKTEPRARWPLVPCCPEASDAVTYVERVGRIDDEESLFLLVFLLSEKGLCRVNRALYPGF